MTETLERYLVEDEEGTRVAAQHEELGRVDVSGLGPVDRVDVRCSDADWFRGGHLDTEHLYAWNMDAHRVELQDSRFGRATLRGLSSRNPLRLERVDADTLELTDVDVPYANLSDAHIDELRLGGDDLGRIDLRGARIGSIQAVLDDVDEYHLVVDEDTYIDEVPDALASDLGYRCVSDEEADLLDMAAAYEDGFSFDDLQHDYKSAIQYAGTIGPLVQRGFLDHEDETFHLTRRGAHAAAYHD